jgi:hypothetical protein
MQARSFYARPSSSFGYWRGVGSEGPLAQGQGSGYGQANQGVGILPPGSGNPAGSTGWSPTLTYLIVFVVAEIVAFGLLGRVLR